MPASARLQTGMRTDWYRPLCTSVGCSTGTDSVELCCPRAPRGMNDGEVEVRSTLRAQKSGDTSLGNWWVVEMTQKQGEETDFRAESPLSDIYTFQHQNLQDDSTRKSSSSPFPFPSQIFCYEKICTCKGSRGSKCSAMNSLPSVSHCGLPTSAPLLFPSLSYSEPMSDTTVFPL